MGDAEWDLDDGHDLWLPSKRLGAVLVLAVVVGGVFVYTFVLGIADENDDRRLHASFEIRTDPETDGWGTGDETVVIRQEGGESADPEQLHLEVYDGASTRTVEDDMNWTGTDERGYWAVGDTVTYIGHLSRNAVVRLVWSSRSGEETTVVGEWTADTSNQFTTTPTTERDTAT